MSGEPPIELEGRRNSPRPSMDSLQRDIEDAIRSANLEVPPHNVRRTSGTTTSGTSTSANSLITRSSYVDFDTKSQKMSRTSRYKAKVQRAQSRFAAHTGYTAARILSPLNLLQKPFIASRKAWRRRNLSPPTKEGRKIPINLIDPPKQIDERTKKPYTSNQITSSIYTVYDFIPRQLFVQFSKSANMYFLFVAILQMIPSWSATGNYTTIVPSCIFVFISMGREGYEDFNRHRNDKEENNRKVLVATPKPDGSGIEYSTKSWKEIKVGDIVRVLQNEWVPADIVSSHSSGVKGQCSIETVALDGETTLKSREVPAAVQEAFRVDTIETAQAEVTCEDPNSDLFNFEGTFQFLNRDTKVIPIGPPNVIYRGSASRNTASVSGLVVYSGKESKMQSNASKNSRAKAPKLQAKVNRIVIILAAFVLSLSGFSTLAAGKIQNSHSYWYSRGAEVTTTQSMMGYIIMFNTLIPSSLYVSMEICKIFQKFLMQNDVDMYDEVNDVRCKVLSASLNEESGQVSYVFSDKTGTLTDNIMLFRKMTVAGYPWIHDLDLYLDPEDDSYLFHKAQPIDSEQLNEEDVELLEQSARSPRRSFGGRIGGHALNRASMGRPSLSRPSLGRPSLGRPSMGRPSLGPSSTRPSGGRTSMGRPSTSRPIEGTRSNLAPTSSNVPTITTGDDTSPRPSGFSTTQWQSTAVPYKQQTTPSTLTMSEYMRSHPNSAFTQRAHFFSSGLALCHSASPEVDSNGEEGEGGEAEIEQLDYQAASPDELALVAAARDLGYLVIDRQYDSITVRTYPDGFDNPPKDEVYKVSDTIEFTSSRKRMSIITQFPDGRIMLFCKGADNVMIERLKKPLVNTAQTTKNSIYAESQFRRSVEAELANENRSFSSGMPPSIDMSLQRRTNDASIYESGRRSTQLRRESIDQQAQAKSYPGRTSVQTAVADATAAAAANAAETRASIEMSRNSFSGAGMGRNSFSANPASSPRVPGPSVRPKEGIDIEDLDERKTLQKTLEKIDEFSTEGLRTSLYCHRALSKKEYDAWKVEYDAAKAAISNRQDKVDEVGEKMERDFSVTGATAIEDKLQRGVPETIDKSRRANIRMWMSTGDKQETAVNIGYSCRLIKDYSTIITLKVNENLEAKIMAALEELDSSTIAHCVVVIDGQTLAAVEKDPVLMSSFVDLGSRADSAIVCRASPAQKATIVKNIRRREPNKTMLAIGDGANDIAMIQSADVGIGIAGREGLQAARSADFSIGQFRFSLKSLLVHGRWNYVRTCKYILSTFYKEFMFYMAQVVFQRYTLFTGTSSYESWSISMFNTLFTSLPVMCVGIFDQDLSPTTLIAVPELYHVGPGNEEFGIRLSFEWLVSAMLECVMASFLAYEFYGFNYGMRDTSLYPIGVVVYIGIVSIVCFKVQFISMYNYITLISIGVVIISIGGYLLFNILIGSVYIVSPAKTYYAAREFWTESGKEVNFWAIALLIAVIGYVFEFSLKILSSIIKPTDTDEFQVMEKDYYLMRRLESESELELHQGWKYQDELDHSWFAIFRGRWPGQPRPKPPKSHDNRNKLQISAETLRLREPVNHDKEIQEIIERRQRETEERIEV